MTDEMLGAAKEKLLRKLNITAPDSVTEAQLIDALEGAECSLLLYLRWDELTAVLLPKAVELAALYYQRDSVGTASGLLKSSSYAEGNVSQSESYLDAADYAAAEQVILDGLAKYREVRIR